MVYCSKTKKAWSDRFKNIVNRIVVTQHSPKDLEALQDYLKEENEEHYYLLGGTYEAEEGTQTLLNRESIVDSWKPNQPSGGKAQNCLDFRSKLSFLFND